MSPIAARHSKYVFPCVSLQQRRKKGALSLNGDMHPNVEVYKAHELRKESTAVIYRTSSFVTGLCHQTLTTVKPKQAGTCGRGIRNEHASKSLICTNIKYYRTYSIYLLSRLFAILLSITKKTARKWKFGIVDDTSCSAQKCHLVLVLL